MLVKSVLSWKISSLVAALTASILVVNVAGQPSSEKKVFYPLSLTQDQTWDSMHGLRRLNFTYQNFTHKKWEQAGAELCQAQSKLKLAKLSGKLACLFINMSHCKKKAVGKNEASTA